MTVQQKLGDAEVVVALGLDRTGRSRRWRKGALRVGLVLGLAATLLVAVMAWSQSRNAPTISYQTQPLSRDDLEVSVLATGTLNALNSVEVGAEITGRVLKVLVNFNDRVTRGQVLAEIDTETYEARLDEANAQVAAAYASSKNAKATLEEAKLRQARVSNLHAQGLASDQELEEASAALARAEASVANSNADASLRQASLQVARTNLGKAVVKSPIDGIVLDRAVEPGQTVTSGLQTPILFTLATDLESMRLEVAVDEADVGLVREGQRATFTVDAYPKREFASKVLAVKSLPAEGSTVVTYETWLSVDNRDRSLRPGMTATATIVVDERKKVLLVPNAALRFTPPASTVSQGFSFNRLLPGPPNRNRSRSAAAASGSAGPGTAEGRGKGKGKGNQRTLFVLENGAPVRIGVEAGATDGTVTEVSSPELREGMAVIVNALEIKS